MEQLTKYNSRRFKQTTIVGILLFFVFSFQFNEVRSQTEDSTIAISDTIINTTCDSNEVDFEVVLINGEEPYSILILTEYDCPTDLVWPGDADRNGIVNAWDILCLGISFNTLGPPREGISSDWSPKVANNWSNELYSDQFDLKHSDCNGDGQISYGDIGVINQKYGERQGIDESDPSLNYSNSVLFIDLPDVIVVGQQVQAPIYLGFEDNILYDIYGLAFNVTLQAEEIVDPETLNITLIDSWLGITDANLASIQRRVTNQSLDVGITRTDQSNASGFGQIGILSFVANDDILGRSSNLLTIQFNNVIGIDATGEAVTLSGISDEAQIIDAANGKVSSINDADVQIHSTSYETIQVSAHESVQIDQLEWFNSNGQLIKSISYTTESISVNDLPPGIYYLRIISNKGILSKKILHMK